MQNKSCMKIYTEKIKTPRLFSNHQSGFIPQRCFFQGARREVPQTGDYSWETSPKLQCILYWRIPFKTNKFGTKVFVYRKRPLTLLQVKGTRIFPRKVSPFFKTGLKNVDFGKLLWDLLCWGSTHFNGNTVGIGQKIEL